MKFGNIDLPDELLDALEKGKIVIFTGAGISIDSPSDLPSFEELIKEIERWSKVKKMRMKHQINTLGELLKKEKHLI
ncbi:MAG: hypothetical protein K8S56_02085 [Candidatus Cloacimonetes bacterium]|nr:hypothetical protein [Candidatus Cloacimonadota bacterium]